MKSENNCSVLGTGDEPQDFAHVKTGNPMDLKRREFQESKQYRTELAFDINPEREAATTRARRTGNARPL
jgi:hypothetical protein